VRNTNGINTNFSPTSFGGTFTGPGSNRPSPARTNSRRTSPSKRGRPSLSASQSRSRIDTAEPGTAPPHSAPQTAKPNASEHGHDVPFAANNWSTQNFFNTSPSTDQRNGSDHHGYRNPHVFPPKHEHHHSESHPHQSQPSTASVSNGDAMDIDGETYHNEDSQARSRPYPMAPSQWRLSQHLHGQSQSDSDDQRRSSSKSSQTTRSRRDMPSLDPLAASLNQSKGEGLHDFSSLSTSIPFPSKPSSAHPSKLFAAETLTSNNPSNTLVLPRLPTPPEQPQKLSKKSFREYTAQLAAYITAYSIFEKTIFEHQSSSLLLQQRLLTRGPMGLEARGEGSSTDSVLKADNSSDSWLSIETYGKRMRDEEKWRELSSVGLARHCEAIEAYLRVKERVRSLVEGVGLPAV